MLHTTITPKSNSQQSTITSRQDSTEWESIHSQAYSLLLEYPRYLRTTYKDSTHKEYCFCIAYNYQGMQIEELRHREMEKEAKAATGSQNRNWGHVKLMMNPMERRSNHADIAALAGRTGPDWSEAR